MKGKRRSNTDIRKDIAWINRLPVLERLKLVKNNQGLAVNLDKLRRDCRKLRDEMERRPNYFYLNRDAYRLLSEAFGTGVKLV